MPLQLNTLLKHHRVAMRDAVLLISALLTAGFIALEFDFVGEFSDDKKVELQELVALGVLFIFGVVLFFWRRLA